jgi:hypothetical protein
LTWRSRASPISTRPPISMKRRLGGLGGALIASRRTPGRQAPTRTVSLRRRSPSGGVASGANAPARKRATTGHPVRGPGNPAGRDLSQTRHQPAESQSPDLSDSDTGRRKRRAAIGVRPKRRIARPPCTLRSFLGRATHRLVSQSKSLHHARGDRQHPAMTSHLWWTTLSSPKPSRPSARRRSSRSNGRRSSRRATHGQMPNDRGCTR